jgi:diketogulonate reductase-like aldo/keto reductase
MKTPGSPDTRLHPPRTVSLADGEVVPALGLGTWRMGEVASRRAAEEGAVRRAIELGYRVFDTAEMYGDGGAESVLGVALAQALRAGDVTRRELFIVSKVLPQNASRAGTRAACERSLRRLGLEQIDLYLLHWRGAHPLADTVAAFETLVADSRIRHWGVSNFDTADMEALAAVRSGQRCATNQVYFSLSERGAAFELLPWMRARAMPAMAYSPIDQGALAGRATLRTIGERHGATAAQVALAWVLAQPGVMAIPKSVQESHLRDNLAAADLALSVDDLAELDREFPPPRGKTGLAMI